MLRQAGIGFAVMAAVFPGPAFCGDDGSKGPLSPGKPAGVHTAQSDADTLLYTYGGVIVLGGGLYLILALSGNNPAAIATSTGNVTQ